jgi:type I restriction enzyme, S subunit
MGSESPIPRPPEWPVVRLGKIATKIGSGATPLGGEASYQSRRSNFALVRSQNVFDRRFDASGLAFISDEQAKKLQGAALQADDLLLNITGDGVTFGRCCAVPAGVLPACVNQHVSIIRVDDTLADPGYVLSLLTHPASKPYIESFNAGGSRRAITKANIESFEIALPPRDEQRAIAHILGTLDDKIELNRQMNETLEAIARAIFKSWFVDFEPVRAKASGESPESVCRRLHLTSDQLALFPDVLAPSELGHMPRGWTAEPLTRLASYLSRGISPKYVDRGGVLVLNQKCVRSGRIDPSKGRRHDFSQRAVDGRHLQVGDVLVNSTGIGTLGRVAQVLDLPELAIVDSHVTVVRADTALVSWNYLGIVLQDREAEIEALGEGSTGQTELSRVRLGALAIPVPPKPLMNLFDHVVLSLRLLASRHERQTLTLAYLRDALLPKLLSGEIRLPVESAA